MLDKFQNAVFMKCITDYQHLLSQYKGDVTEVQANYAKETLSDILLKQKETKHQKMPTYDELLTETSDESVALTTANNTVIVLAVLLSIGIVVCLMGIFIYWKTNALARVRYTMARIGSVFTEKINPSHTHVKESASFSNDTTVNNKGSKTSRYYDGKEPSIHF